MFRQIKKEEVKNVFELILDRIEWMNENNIHQWSETNYTDAYPLSYYEEKREQAEKTGRFHGYLQRYCGISEE